MRGTICPCPTRLKERSWPTSAGDPGNVGLKEAEATAKCTSVSRTITLSCSGGGGPGAGWSATAELRPTDGGFAVWQRDANGRLRRVKRCSRPLLWREAAYALRASSLYGLHASSPEDVEALLQDVYVDGVMVPWQADMLRLAWITLEETNDDLLGPLLKLDDDQLRELWSHLGSFRVSAALEKLREFVKLQEEYGLSGLELVERIAKDIGLEKAPSLDEFLTMIDSIPDRIEESRALALEPFAASINDTVDRFSKSLPQPHTFITGMTYSEKCLAFRKYLENFVLKSGKQPEGNHDIPGLGTVDFGLLWVDTQHT
jgi:hypothetical protein